MKKAGFTLIEILIAVLIIGMIYSIVLPFSQRLLEKYQALKAVEELKVFILKKKSEAFFYGEKIEIISKEGVLFVNENETFSLKDTYIDLENPLIFYPLGTTNGGIIKARAGSFEFKLEILAPFGEIRESF
ncbi:MAG: type II secretion system protein [candidate division WOR-3 bacterium]